MLCLAGASPAEASIVSGIGKILSAAFQLPLSVLAGTFTGPPIIGTALGAFNGAFNTVGLLAGGAIDLASSAVPIAKAAAPFFLPFLL